MPIGTVDYSKYPYKISELKQLDWDGLCFSLYFVRPLNKDEKVTLEKSIINWFNQTESDENSPHYLSDFTWDSDSEATFYIDFGSVEIVVLENLLDELSKFKDIINELLLGRNPVTKERTRDELLKPVDQMDVDPTKYPFRIFELWQDTTDTPFTINFTKQLDKEEKQNIETVIYDYFTKDKEDVDERKYFLGVKWVNSQTVGWWTSYFPLRPTTLDPLLTGFIPYKDIIREVIIGVYLDYEVLKKFL